MSIIKYWTYLIKKDSIALIVFDPYLSAPGTVLKAFATSIPMLLSGGGPSGFKSLLNKPLPALKKKTASN